MAVRIADGPREADLELARGCVEGDPRLVRDFDLRFRRLLSSIAKRSGIPSGDVEDAVQVFVAHLLLSRPDGTCVMSAYEGTGSLEAWLRVVAARFFRRRNATRDRSAETTSDVDADPVFELRPELEHLRARFGDAYESAIAAGVRSLSGRPRAVLTLNVEDGLSATDIGLLYGVHRTTVSRWIDAARSEVLVVVRRVLLEDVDMTPRDVEVIGRMLVSQLHVSLARHLRAHAD